jgi:hypothetical protein
MVSSSNRSSSGGATLSDVTAVGRLAVKYGAIGIVVLIIGRMVWGASITLYRRLNPPPPPPPTVGFGLLPKIAFPQQVSAEKPSSYVLETANGRLPVFGDRASVYFMPFAPPSLLGDQRAKQLAAELDFVFQPQIINARTYRWTRSQPLESVLEMDIQDYTFTLTTDYKSRVELLTKQGVPSSAEAVDRVKNMLRKMDLLTPDLVTASGEVLLYKAVGDKLEPAVSVSDTDFVQVDITRTPIGGRRMFTPEGYVGTVTAIVAGGNLNNDDSVVELQYRHHAVDYTVAHTYPLRSVNEAWQLLQAGEGYIADGADVGQAVIRDVELGYFDSFTDQAYLQPIYVFLGDDDFIGYIPALDQEYVQQTGAQK